MVLPYLVITVEVLLSCAIIHGGFSEAAVRPAARHRNRRGHPPVGFMMNVIQDATD